MAVRGHGAQHYGRLFTLRRLEDVTVRVIWCSPLVHLLFALALFYSSWTCSVRRRGRALLRHIHGMDRIVDLCDLAKSFDLEVTVPSPVQHGMLPVGVMS